MQPLDPRSLFRTEARPRLVLAAPVIRFPAAAWALIVAAGLCALVVIWTMSSPRLLRQHVVEGRVKSSLAPLVVRAGKAGAVSEFTSRRGNFVPAGDVIAWLTVARTSDRVAVRAEQGGYVSAVMVNVGAKVTETDVVAHLLPEASVIEIDAELDAAWAGRVQPGMSATVRSRAAGADALFAVVRAVTPSPRAGGPLLVHVVPDPPIDPARALRSAIRAGDSVDVEVPVARSRLADLLLESFGPPEARP